MRILNKQNFNLSFLTLSLFSSLVFSTSAVAKIDFIDRLNISSIREANIHMGQGLHLLSDNGKTMITSDIIVSNINFNTEGKVLATEGGITYREINENNLGLIKELGVKLLNLESEHNGTLLTTLSSDGLMIAAEPWQTGKVGIWHYNPQEGWQNEYLTEGAHILAFNANGNIAGGSVGGRYAHDIDESRPTLWIKNNQNQWQPKFLSNEKNKGIVYNVNQDGTVAIGIIKRVKEDSIMIGIPTLWTGKDWKTEINLAESGSFSGNLGNGEPYAINSKGDVVGGEIDGKPAIWSGDNWGEITFLSKTNGLVAALNAKGNIAAGTSEEYGYRPVIWSGEKWQIVTPLTSENEYGDVFFMSSDGTIVGGTIDGASFTLWRITYSEVPDNAPTAPLEEGQVPPEPPITGPAGSTIPDPDTSEQPVSPPTSKPETPNKPAPPTETAKPTTPAEPKPAAKPPVVTAMIDVPNTQQAIMKMGHDTFELFSLQFGALRRLQEECVAGKGEICYALQHNYTAQNGNYDNALSLRIGYGFTDNLTFGVNFDRSLRRSLPDTYRRLSGNGGVGVFGYYQLPYNTYVSAGIGWDYYRIQAQRPLLANTEFAPTKSRVHGLAWNVTVGQDFTLANDTQLGWYVAYRQTEIKRDGYRENVPGFPVKYGAANLKDNAIAVGAKFALPITPKLSWISAVEFERRLGGESPVYSAKAQYVGDVRYQPDLNHSRWNAQTGVRYAFAPNLSLSLTPFWGNSIVGNNQWGTRLTLEGKF